MKKQLEKELEQREPYNRELKEQILKSKRKPNPWKCRAVLLSFVLILTCIGVFALTEDSPQNVALDSTTEVESFMTQTDDGYLYGNSLMKITKNGEQIVTELQMIADYYLTDGTYVQTKLTSGYYNVVGNEVIDDVQKIVVRNEPLTVVTADEMAGQIVKNSEVKVKKQIAKVFDKSDKKKDLRFLDGAIIRDEERSFKAADKLAFQRIFGQVEWQVGVKKEQLTEPDAQMTLLIDYDENQPEYLLNYYFWLENGKVEVIGDDGYGELTGENEEVLKAYLLTDKKETTDLSKGKPSPFLTITNPDELALLKELFKDAVKLIGIANIVDPQYRIQLENDLYFLWFNEDDTAAIMNANETHTIYTISSAEKIKEIIDQVN
ncbi:hypothetical protein AEA09_10775 [Lysinibacillus contaminans]|uniref:YhfM-like domain-containing protein n=1 Tax=Lysinibacillus contaminans TaxID=1293441 RepID=A0ABR5K2A4_9BACI|nr:hypothetical protein [Lysinibacillus contaminans]KOS68981.1 hypothetical protein AEA09_10775 [Lysinibacillus contaminans]